MKAGTGVSGCLAKGTRAAKTASDRPIWNKASRRWPARGGRSDRKTADRRPSPSLLAAIAIPTPENSSATEGNLAAGRKSRKCKTAYLDCICPARNLQHGVSKLKTERSEKAKQS